MGHRARHPASWRMVDANGYFMDDRLDHNLGKIHDVDVARFEIRRYQADGKTLSGQPEILGSRVAGSARRGLARTSPTRRSADFPASEGRLRRHHHVGLLHPAPDAVAYARWCLEFFGQVRDAVRRLSKSRSISTASLVARCSPVSSMDERYVMVGCCQAQRAAEDGAAGRSRRRRRECGRAGGVWPTCAGAEGFVAVSADTRKKFWLDRSRTAAISRHERLQDQRRRRDSAAAHGRLLRRHRSHQHRVSIKNKLALCDALERAFQNELPLHQNETELSAEELLGDRRTRALDLVATVRRRWRWLLSNLDLPVREAEAEFSVWDRWVRSPARPRTDAVPPLAGSLGSCLLEARVEDAARCDLQRPVVPPDRREDRDDALERARGGLRRTPHACG